MILIYTLLGKNPEQTTASINAMMKAVDIAPQLYKIIDIAEEKPEIGKNRNLIAFGKKAAMAVVTALVNEEFIVKNSYIGKPLIDEKNAFFFYGLHLEISDIMANDDNKQYVWEVLQDMANYYKQWNPFNDTLDFGLPKETEVKMDQLDKAIVETQDGFTDIQVVTEGTSFSTVDLITKLIEKVDFSDVGLGKSLSKFDKIQLVTSNGYKLNVLPTVRENTKEEKDEINISYKDLLSLLKVIMLTGSKSIEFFEG